ncbi:heavy metal-binding domain-containing protein [candidate division KSB3 bacterium]|uniref:Heavy metal-binding domain-containing protein n=1 Tax=candidate division KSB3 bacterium TaxID=2044937 RepID=A0A9D5JSG1_9BACT|nr:heavy metal-binding domain-containing protein [candidate division KSB3 bacterium]MBD3323363.1 heavy metal-binding domain-containing protein [candidate division KSB3 bacterium]
MEQLLIVIVLIVVGYSIGKLTESRHYRSIEAREQELLRLPAVTLKNALDPERIITDIQLVSGNAVISVDYFKRFLASLRNFFGGKMISYESLIDRARREAILRMKAEAPSADIILNLRLETSSISKGAKNKVSSIEALAYGTAITYGADRAPQSAPQATAAAQPPPDEPIAPPVEDPSAASYRVVFAGEIAPGQDLETVKANVAALYKMPVERCERLFSGRRVTIKDRVDYRTAEKYVHAFERVGAVCYIEAIDL